MTTVAEKGRNSKTVKPHIYMKAGRWKCRNIRTYHTASKPLFAWRGWKRNIDSIARFGKTYAERQQEHRNA